MRQPLVAAPGGGDVEARRPRPVHEIADQRRLITIGEAVHDGSFAGVAREQRPAHRVGFHRHHDDMLAMPEGRECVLDRSDRIARGFDDDVDQRMRNERLPILADMRTEGRKRRVQRRGRIAFRNPAHPLQIGFRVCRRQVRDTGKV